MSNVPRIRSIRETAEFFKKMFYGENTEAK